MAMSKEIGTAAGELAELFGKRDSNYPTEKIQEEIKEVLERNNIIQEQQTSFFSKIGNKIKTTMKPLARRRAKEIA